MRPHGLVILVAVTALLFAGCGDDEPAVTPGAARWATEYCTALESLAEPLEEADVTLQEATIETPAQAQEAFAPVGTAATAFADDMASLPPTDTSGSAAVKKQTDTLARTVDKYVDQAQVALDAWKSGSGSKESTLSVVGSELRATRQSLGTTTAAIRNVDTDVDAAITESPTCTSLIEDLNS